MFKKLFFTITIVSVFGLCFFGRAENIYAYSYECSDNIDNDGDGKKDYSATAGAGDAQCADANDDHESDYAEGYFFKAHTTYNQRIPANPVVDTARTAAFQAELAASNPRMYIQPDAWPTYVADETSENVTVTMLNDCSSYNGAAAIAQGWNLNIPLNATNIPHTNYESCTTPRTDGSNTDHQMIIVSADGTKMWDIYRARNCTLPAPNGTISPYDKNKWTACIVRMYSSNENGVDSQYTENNTPRGDMACSWASNYSSFFYDSLGAKSSLRLARLTGALKYSDMASGSIDHAIPITWKWRRSASYPKPVYPSCGEGYYHQTTNIHEGWLMGGERVFLDLTYSEIDAIATARNLSATKKKILYAMKDYGMIMTEATGDNIIYINAVGESQYNSTDWLNLIGANNPPTLPHRYFPDEVKNDIRTHLKIISPLSMSPYQNGTLSGFPGQPQCADGIDNDADGKIDYPADPGCSSAYSDNTELDSATTCSSFTYSAWSACQSSNTQTRTIISSFPAGCTGGSPILTQGCTAYSINDFISLISNWLKTMVSPSDINKDGIINTRDLGIMMTNWK